MAKLDIGPICHEHLLSPFSHHIHIPARAGVTRGKGGGGVPPPLLNFSKLETKLVKSIDLMYYCFLHRIFRSSTASDGLQNGMKHFFKEHSYFHVTSAFTRFIFTSWIFILTYYELCINILWKLNVQKIEIALSEWTSFNNISCFRVVWLNSCLPKKTFFESKVRYCKAENDQILKNLECISIAPYLCFQK